MRIRDRILALLALLALAAVASNFTGCASSETNRVAQSITATTAQAHTALILHNAHVTTPAQEVRIHELLKAEQAAEDSYYASIRAGDSAAMKAAKSAWAAASQAAQIELAKYTIPTTQPK